MGVLCRARVHERWLLNLQRTGDLYLLAILWLLDGAAWSTVVLYLTGHLR